MLYYSSFTIYVWVNLRSCTFSLNILITARKYSYIKGEPVFLENFKSTKNITCRIFLFKILFTGLYICNLLNQGNVLKDHMTYHVANFSCRE